jgi:hypothetical protein
MKSEFRLVVENQEPASALASVLCIGEISILLASATGTAIRTAPLDESNGDTRLCILEQLRPSGRTASLVMIEPIPRLHVNGLPVPAVSVLSERDELTMPSTGLRIHVTQFQDAAVGKPNPELIGKQSCALCRTVISPDTLSTYECQCGAIMHAESHQQKQDAAMNCWALTTECPVCSRPVNISNEGGYTYWPEGVTK